MWKQAHPRRARTSVQLKKILISRSWIYWNELRPDLDEPCWIMDGDMKHYGRLHSRPDFYGHRVSYRIFNGPISDDLFVCHKCDVQGCVNPNHLFLGTNIDNMQDAKFKGRTRGGPPKGKPKSETHRLNLQKAAKNRIRSTANFS